MDKRKRLVDLPYSDSESDDESPKKKYLKKEESDSENDFLPKKKPVRMIEESDSEDDVFSPKKNPSQINEDNDEKNIEMTTLYNFNDELNKKSRKFRTESHVFTCACIRMYRIYSHVFTVSFKRFEDLPPHQLGALFDDVSQQIKQKLNAEPSDMIRLSINHPALDMEIHIPFMCAEQQEGTILLDQMEKSLTIQCRVQAE